MPFRWDNISILQAVDRHQARFGGGEVTGVNGRELMDDVAGSQVTDDGLVGGFVRELEIAQGAGYLAFAVDDLMGTAAGVRRSYPYQYLQLIRNFALTVVGQDRARGIVVIQPLPDPAEDDGRPISRLILQQIVDAIAEEFTPEQIPDFLADGGLDVTVSSATGDASLPPDLVYDILLDLEGGGGDDRRILRSFIGGWLDDRLISGPTDELRTKLLDQLARRGWYVQDSRLVSGEPTRGQRVNSPILQDARLAALHPTVQHAAGRLFRDGHQAAAVFETAKAVTNRVKRLSGLSSDGSAMMAAAFKDENPLFDWPI